MGSTDNPQPVTKPQEGNKKTSKVFLLISNLLFLAVLILAFIKGILTFSFSFSTVGSILMFVWLIVGVLLFVLSILFFLKINLSFLFKLFFNFFSLSFFVVFTFFIVINIFIVFLPFSSSESTGKNNNTTVSNTTSTVCNQSVTVAKTNVELVKNYDFTAGKSDWTTQIWYQPNTDTYNQISLNNGVVTINAQTGIPNSRVGLMQTINVDVSKATAITLKAKVKADVSTLPGSGWNGREGPIAVSIIYYDNNCVLHNALGENPNEARHMFWQGFYFQEPESFSQAVSATKVTQGSWYEYTVDLKDLNPQIIVSVGLEGAGWAPRAGSVDYLSLKVK